MALKRFDATIQYFVTFKIPFGLSLRQIKGLLQGLILAMMCRNVDITAATEKNASSSDYSKRSSGLLGSGGLSLTLGTRSQSSAQKQAGDTAAGSVIGSTGGNVRIQAGQTYTQTGSDVLAPTGDIDIQAKKVDITEAREKRSDSSEQKFSQSGITVALSVPVIESVQGIAQMASAVQDTRSERAKAMGAAMAALKTREALAEGEAAVKSLADGKVPDGVSLSVSLGSSQSRSNSASTGDSGRGSSVAAGGDVTIRATGGGISGETASDLTVRGSSVQSGGDITLKADNRVRLLSSQDESAQSGSDSSGSAAIGLSVGLGAKSAGLSLTASASRALGNSNGSATTQQDSTVAAGKKLTIDSGGDTDILGATASGETVKVAVGGNLNMASRQDTATFKEDSKNIGFNASIPLVGSGGSASLSAGKTNIRSDYASTQTTSGIKAGDGGFNVQVQGKTTLDGAVIASSDKAVAEGKNRFSSDGGLELKDIANTAKYSADSVSAGVGISGGKPDNYGEKPAQKSGPTLNSAGIGTDSGNASSITQAGISGIAGDTAVRSGDVGSGIKPIFDADRARADVNAQVAITKEFGATASKYIGDKAEEKLNESQALKAQADAARREGKVELANTLQAQALQLDSDWGPNGTLRVLAHTAVGGLTGGAGGAAGAAAGTITAPVMMEALQAAGIDESLAKGLTALASTTVGAAAGGTAGGAAAMNEVANNTLYHYQGKIVAHDKIHNDKVVGLSRDELEALALKEAREGNPNLLQQVLAGLPGTMNTVRIDGERFEDFATQKNTFDLRNPVDREQLRKKTEMTYVVKPGENPSIWFMNGMDNTADQAWATAGQIALLTNQSVGLINNSTDGIPKDIVEYLPERATLKEALNEYTLREINDRGPGTVVLHSAGNEDYRKAVVLGNKMGYMYNDIGVLSLGSPASASALRKAANAVGSTFIGQINDWRDPVTYSKTAGVVTVGSFLSGVAGGVVYGGIQGCGMVSAGGLLGCAFGGVIGGAAGGAAGALPGALGLFGLKGYHPMESYLKRTDVQQMLKQLPRPKSGSK